MTEAKLSELILTKETLQTHFAEAYRGLRTNISFSGIGQPLKSLVVSSAGSGEGKTTTVINLGIIMAQQTGSKVLIVDTNLRRSSIHEVMGLQRLRINPMVGLSNVLEGTARLDDVIMQTGFDRLGIVPAGATPPNPSELLGSRQMQEVMEELKQLADIVVMDSPPCLLYSDAFLIAGLADGILYVVRAGRQDKATQRRVRSQIQRSGARLLGVVLNDVNVTDSAGVYASPRPTTDPANISSLREVFTLGAPPSHS